MTSARVGAAALFLTATMAAAPAASDPPAGASACSGCHAAAPGVDTLVPRLVGRSADDIVIQMQAFQSGQKPATVMHRIANGFTDAETAAIAAWYAGQK